MDLQKRKESEKKRTKKEGEERLKRRESGRRTRSRRTGTGYDDAGSGGNCAAIKQLKASTNGCEALPPLAVEMLRLKRNKTISP